MGIQKRTRKFATTKRVIGKNDARRKETAERNEALTAAKKAKHRGGPAGDDLVRHVEQAPSQLFLASNQALTPPYSILVDSSFITRTTQFKLPLLETFMDCLYASVEVIITDCVLFELEKLGPKFKIPLRIARDERWTRLKCQHKGVYADDCMVDRVQKDRIYLVATQDKELQSRLRRIPGVPIVKCGRGKYTVERLPGALS